MTHQYRIGERCICIDDTFKNVSIDQGLRAQTEYTVRWAGNYHHYIDGDFYGVKLAEIDRGNDDDPSGGYGYADMPFRASRFKPVVSPKIEKRIVEEV